jgi:hypothetical protein
MAVIGVGVLTWPFGVVADVRAGTCSLDATVEAFGEVADGDVAGPLACATSSE